MTFLYYASLFLFLAICAVLCLLILIQESKSMGLGASFGGDSGDSLFGTSTAEVLKRITAWCIAIFMGSCLLLSLWTSALGQSKDPSTLHLPEWARHLEQKK